MGTIWDIHSTNIKILDCTVRDGGLVNDHHFEDSFVKRVYDTCVAAGIDYMEVGYKYTDRLFAPDKFGRWKFCREDDVRRVIGDMPSKIPLTAMIDVGKTDWRTDVSPKKQSIFSVMRVAFYIYQLDEAIDMINDSYQKGYDVWANLMAVSTLEKNQIENALERLVKTPASVIVVVDSFGSLYPQTMESLVSKYFSYASAAGKQVGIHAHNNQQLAFANSMEAIAHGATCVDATLGGLGRGAGNCPMELMLGVLRNPKYSVRPVYGALEELIAPMQKTNDWGPSPQYNITGQMNRHPREAIAARDNRESREKYLSFYDQVRATPPSAGVE